jgi:oligopeptide transport system permease protein
MKKILRYFAFIYLLLFTVLIAVNIFFLKGQSSLQNIDAILQGPSILHWFGTDSLGRDIFLRVLSGGKVSLLIAIVCAPLTVAIGFAWGAIAAWSQGFADRALMIFVDVFMALPSFVLVAVFCFALQTWFSPIILLILAISLTHWMAVARFSRGLVLEMKTKPFIEAAVALGGTGSHIMIRHVLPNILSQLFVIALLQIPTSILYESYMSFVGLGIQPPETSLGLLVREGWKTLSVYPHLILFPSMILFLTVWSIHILIDDLRGQ